MASTHKNQLKTKSPTRPRPKRYSRFALRKYEYFLVREATDAEFRRLIRTPRDAVAFLAEELEKSDKECLYSIHLNSQSEVIGFELLSVGVHTKALSGSREIFMGALLSGASQIILVHNHPSGNPRPSHIDEQNYAHLCFASALLDLKIIDEIVVAGRRFCSIPHKDKGYIDRTGHIIYKG